MGLEVEVDAERTKREIEKYVQEHWFGDKIRASRLWFLRASDDRCRTGSHLHGRIQDRDV